MKRMDVMVAGAEFVFRTNDDGFALFTGIAENRQISCENGFDSLRRMKHAIRRYLEIEWEMGYFDGTMHKTALPRISYSTSSEFRI